MKLVVDFALVTGIVGTIFILFSLFRSQQKELPHKILISIFVVIFFVVVGFYSVLHSLNLLLYISFIFYFTPGYLSGPLFFLYIKSLYHPEENFLKKNWLHFIPFILITIILGIPALISQIKGKHIFDYLRTIDNNDWDNYETAFQAIFFIFYCLLSLHLLKKHRKTLKQNFSNLQEKDLNWIKYLIIGCLVAMSIDITILSYQWNFGKFETDLEMQFLTIFPLIFMIIYLGYHGLTQSKILLPAFILNEASTIIVSEENIQKATHHLSNATATEIDTLKTNLLSVLEKDKPYLDEELTLGRLAALVPTTDKKLSALLNNYLNVSFYDLINQYRVEEVKAKMADSKFSHYTLLAIGFDCGFKSKTSFNRIFKKETGLSPSKYKASLV